MAGTYDIGAEEVSGAFARIEEDLLESMWRNLERHHVEEVAEGGEWVQWQAAQLAELERYTRENALRCAPAFDALNERVTDLITEAYDRGYASQEAELLYAAKKGWEAERQQGFLRLPRERVDALVRATHDDMMRAEHATLRRAADIYRRTIFDAQVYATSGAGTYGKCIDMATHDFVAKGIDGITYRNGSRHTIREYSQMAVRTATKRAALVAEGDARREWGVHTVFVNHRTDACPECMQWVGRVLVDDVYSGGTAEEAERTGYTLLSEAMAQGLFHPNCRDTCSTYFEGVSDLPERPTEAERERAEEREAEEQRLDALEGQAEREERLAHFSMDMGDRLGHAGKAQEYRERAEEATGADTRAAVVGRVTEGLVGKGLSGTDAAEVAELVADAPEEARAVFERFMPDLRFSRLDGGGAYSPTQKTIAMDLGEVRRGRTFERPWEVLFHEFGHLIDNYASGTRLGFLSNDRGLGETVKREVQALVSRVKAENGLRTVQEARDLISLEVRAWYREDPRQLGGVSDLLGGATGNKCCRYLPGHSTSYWRGDLGMENLSSEAFAEFFQCVMCNPSALARMQEYFPESYELFMDLLREIANG